MVEQQKETLGLVASKETAGQIWSGFKGIANMSTKFWLELRQFGAFMTSMPSSCVMYSKTPCHFKSFSGNKDKTMASMIKFPDIVTELSFIILDVKFADFQRCQPKRIKIQEIANFTFFTLKSAVQNKDLLIRS